MREVADRRLGLDVKHLHANQHQLGCRVNDRTLILGTLRHGPQQEAEDGKSPHYPNMTHHAAVPDAIRFFATLGNF